MNRILDYAGAARLLLGEPKTAAEKVLINVSSYSGYGIIVGTLLWALTGVNTTDSAHLSIVQRGAIAVTAISAVTYILVLPFAGMVALGREAGRKNVFTQVVYVLGRVFLFFLLPCLVITFLLILVMVLTGDAPAFTGGS